MSRFYLAVLFCVSVQLGFSSSRVIRIRVPENHRGPWPWYLTKIEKMADVWREAALAGDEDGIFRLDPESGFLYALRPFDREEKENYSVTVNGGGESVTVNIDVMDENDNTPILDQKSLRGVVSRGTQSGVSFMHVAATDGDDPATENADLRYTIIQSEDGPFQIEPRTGAVSPTERGVTSLSQGDVGYFRLVVQVKDLGDGPSGFVASGHLDIVVAENTWSAPRPVSIPENRRGDHPFLISQVRWNSTEIRYEVSGGFQGDLFTIDQSGNIYVTEELDWERQSEYQIGVSALNADGVRYGDPLRLTVTVTDENDNAPAFPQDTYRVRITEAAEKGSHLLKLKAEDADDPSTRNADIVYNIESQEPQLPGDGLFHIGARSGQLTLLEDSLEPTKYTLIVSATDWAGEPGGLRGSCMVIIDVMDLNDNPPVFTANQFPRSVIAEDAAPGTSIVTLTASDGDVEAVNKAMEFSIQSGNEDGTFGIKPDEERSTVTIFLEKDLDYEKVPEYLISVSVRNAVELHGVEYGPGSALSVVIAVGDVDEAPAFTQERYQVRLPETMTTGTSILTVSACDPDTQSPAPLRYSLHGDSRGWLSIGEDSGVIRLRHSVDGERRGEVYGVTVVAQEAGDGGLSASAEVLIRFLDADDNEPILIGDYSLEYFCTPRREEQRTVIRAFDKDSPENATAFTFSLPDALRSQWMLTAINGTHASLSMRSQRLEPRAHRVPIVIGNTGATTQSKDVPITVTVCQCNSRALCKVEADEMEGMPTLSSALGIILGTLGAIGIFLIIIFIRVTRSAPRHKTPVMEEIPLKSAA